MTLCLNMFCMLILGASDDDAVKKDLAHFEGVWSFVEVIVDGKKQPDVPVTTHKLIIWKNGHCLVQQGTRLTRSIIKIDPTQSPGHYDVSLLSGSNSGMTSHGIYALQADTFQLCFSLKSKERATRFESAPGSGQMLQAFKREKVTVEEALLEAGRLELAGSWQAVTYSLNGQAASEEDLKKVRLVIDKDGKATALNEGKVFLVGTTRIDLTQQPMTIDISYSEGELKGKTSLGIYQVEGSKLTICRAAPGQPRPTVFSSKPESGHTLMSYRRE
ncbi:MAG TPA: TIGR03067 domain-containing protein [Gemmatales bacterium]|nr:TIGR03067 domain-containing protein [Gemmatales bacterium]